MISLQTNITSLIAQANLNADNQFQSKTIQQLTSGYRINSSGDDAAGLAVANAYRGSVAELSQGLRNATDATSQLQIVDGGLSNISTILDRLKTLATESASSTFTGDRNTLNQEYLGLVSDITRQATNVNLNAGGSLNAALNVFVGGGSNMANSSVAVDLSGTHNAVDADSLGLAVENVPIAPVPIAGVDLTNNTQSLDAPGATFLSGNALGTESFYFVVGTSSGAQSVIATVNGSVAGISKDEALSQLNSQLNQYGMTAGVDSNGLLQFSGTTPFNLYAEQTYPANVFNSPLVSVTSFGSNGPTFTGFNGAAATDSESVVIQVAGQSIPIVLNAANASTPAAAAATISALTQPYGLGVGWGSNVLSIQSTSNYSITSNNSTPANGFFSQGSNSPTSYSTQAQIPANTNNFVAYATIPGVPVPENLSIQVGGHFINVALTVADQQMGALLRLRSMRRLHSTESLRFGE